MIVGNDSKGGPEASSSNILWSTQAPPPLYVQDDRDIDPIDKTPAFPVPEDHRPAYSTTITPRSYYATPSSASGSASTSPQLGDGRDLSLPSSFASYDALPSAFGRAPPPELSYPAFNPIFVVSQGKSVDKGFPAAPPPSDIQPHPFISHDVGEGDWLSFLNAVRAAATLTEKDVRRSYLPIISIIPIVNTIAAIGVQKIMKTQKGGKISKTIYIWNHHFFGPRKLRVILMKGRVKLSGPTELPAEEHLSPANLAPVAADDDLYRLFVVSI